MKKRLETAVLKTLIYSDIFDYPLTDKEVILFLEGVEIIANNSVEVANPRLVQDILKNHPQIENQENYFFLKDRKEIVDKRKRREKYSAWDTWEIYRFLKCFLPWKPWRIPFHHSNIRMKAGLASMQPRPFLEVNGRTDNIWRSVSIL